MKAAVSGSHLEMVSLGLHCVWGDDATAPERKPVSGVMSFPQSSHHRRHADGVWGHLASETLTAEPQMGLEILPPHPLPQGECHAGH